MSSARFSNRLGNICRRVARWCGAPEISQRRIGRFLETVNGEIGPLRGRTPPATVSVVIPCFGHASFLTTALTSIVNQSRLPDEVIAVDDCSPDATGAILKEHLEKLGASDKVRCSILTNDRNRGQAFSLNRAIAESGSDLVMILNDDDYLVPDAVELMLDLFRRQRDVVLIGGTSVRFTRDDQLTKLSETCPAPRAGGMVELSVRMPADVPGYRSYNDLNMTHSGCCFLKSAWKAVGGYNPDKRTRVVPFSDRDFQLRVNALFPVAVCSEVPFSCWRSGSSVDCGRDS